MRREPRAPAEPINVKIELVTERQGVLGYRYRRLTIEQQGKTANARELRLQLDYDLQFELSTKRRDLVKVRGRRITAAELASLWAGVQKLRPARLDDRYEFLDSVSAEDLDETVGADGEPIAVSTGEEGPCCLTIEWDEKPARGRKAKGSALRHVRKRIVIERFREPEAEAAESPWVRRAPLTALCAMVDAKLKAERPFNYRKVDVFASLAEEFASLRTRHFVNLRQFERRIVEALGAARDQEAIPLLETELFATDSRVRLQALDALAAIGDERAVPAVEGLIYDDETPVREKARRILKSLKAAR
ncbi:MAG TPA: HEAT repeat domain-containing protein [Planctomycetota bacterium]|nr:HEAT repeat domain-containing protein [Planctomycetota bacterium]